MILKTLLLASLLTCASELRLMNGVAHNPVQSIACDTDDDTGGEITGAYGGTIIGHGYVWFHIGNTQMRMLEANFPNPIPAEGASVTATGCTPDPDYPGSFICTGLKVN